METLKKNLANLLKVKTIVTLMLTLVFCIMTLLKFISPENFMAIFSMIITFYFATQTEKKNTEDGGGQA